MGLFDKFETPEVPEAIEAEDTVIVEPVIPDVPVEEVIPFLPDHGLDEDDEDADLDDVAGAGRFNDVLEPVEA